MSLSKYRQLLENYIYYNMLSLFIKVELLNSPASFLQVIIVFAKYISLRLVQICIKYWQSLCVQQSES